jgi:hypothetical protein
MPPLPGLPHGQAGPAAVLTAAPNDVPALAREPLRRRIWAGALEDARLGGFPPRWGRAVFWFPTVGGLLVGATIVHKPLFFWILTEDRPVEWLQFTLLLFATLTAGLGSVRMARQGQWAGACLYLLFTVAVLGLGGEEISWGQRAFGLAPPAALASVNDQRELNLHNVVADGVDLDALSDDVSSAMSAALLVLALAVRLPVALGGRTPPLLTLPAVRVISPALVFAPALLFSATFSWLQWVPRIGSTTTFWKYEEWAELCRYLALAGLATEWAVRYAGRSAVQRGGSGRHVRPRLWPAVADPWVIGFLAFSGVVTVVLAVLSARNNIQIVHVAH